VRFAPSQAAGMPKDENIEAIQHAATHPGRVCDYDEKADCAETIGVKAVAQPCRDR
jgi:hypothetical protein